MTKKKKSISQRTIIISAVILSIGIAYAGHQISQIYTSNGTASIINNIKKNNQKEIDDKVKAGIKKHITENSEKKLKENVLIKDITIDNDAILGDKNAPVTIVEFSDYQCPFCRKAFLKTFPKIKEKYIDTGKVRWIFRDLPLSSHARAIPAAMAAECAGEESDAKYYEMHNLLFQNNKNLEDEDLKRYATEINLDLIEFNRCYDNRLQQNEILKDLRDAKKIGLRSTPGFFVNGWYIKGAKSFEIFENYIEKELEK